jgi:hypothetical protein
MAEIQLASSAQIAKPNQIKQPLTDSPGVDLFEH